MVCASLHQLRDLMRSMRKHNALFILATIYLKGSWCCLICKAPLLEIATTDLLANDESLGSKEVNFCAGNLSCVAIDSFKSKHICNIFRRWCLSNRLIKLIFLLTMHRLIQKRSISMLATYPIFAIGSFKSKHTCYKDWNCVSQNVWWKCYLIFKRLSL